MTCSMVDKQDKNPSALEYDRKKKHSHIKMKEMADCFDYIEIQELISKNQIFIEIFNQILNKIKNK